MAIDAPETVKTPAINLLRIVQEAVTNALKHAGASEITISAGRDSVHVVDNGRSAFT